MGCESGACGRAKGFNCGCRYCLGAKHGTTRIRWAAALATPAGERDDVAQALARTAIRERNATREALKSRVGELRGRRTPARRQRRTKKDARLACSHARDIDLVDRLVNEAVDLASLQELDRAIIEATARVLVPELGDPEKCKKVADHFWCEVLAQLAIALDQLGTIVEDSADALADMVANAVVPRVEDAGQARKWASVVGRALIKRALRAMILNLVTPVPGLADKVTLSVSAEQCRQLALMLCPDPESHPLVHNTCLVPWLRDGVADSLQQRLLVLAPSLRDDI